MMGFKTRPGSDAAANATRHFPPSSEAEFEALLACYRSGQISEKQWQRHLNDEAFAAYLARGGRPQAPTAKPVIVRTGRGTAYFGFLARRSGREVELDHARRITSVNGAPILSEIATHGTAGAGIRLDAPVSTLLTDVVEIIGCTAEALRSLEAD